MVNVMASRSSGGIRRRTSYDKIGNMFPDGNPGCRMLLTIWYGETSDVERLRRSYIYEGTTVVVPELLGSAAYQGELLFSFGPLLLLSNPLGDKQQSTLSRRSVGYRVPKPLPVRVSPIQPRITLGVAGNEKRVINATTPTPVQQQQRENTTTTTTRERGSSTALQLGEVPGNTLG